MFSKMFLQSGHFSYFLLNIFLQVEQCRLFNSLISCRCAAASQDYTICPCVYLICPHMSLYVPYMSLCVPFMYLICTLYVPFMSFIAFPFSLSELHPCQGGRVQKCVIDLRMHLCQHPSRNNGPLGQGDLFSNLCFIFLKYQTSNERGDLFSNLHLIFLPQASSISEPRSLSSSHRWESF